MAIDSVTSFLEPEWSQYQTLFHTAIKSPYSLLTQINNHLTTNQGKQIRPLLSLLSAKMFGVPAPLSVVIATVVEMVHTATLLHDDVADQSDTRRGALTVQKRFSPLASVLLGDFWLARAFQLLMDHQGAPLLCYFARSIREMSEGELFQMEKAAMGATTITEYYQIIGKKTATLMAAGMAAGASSAGANSEQCTLIEKVGFCLGVAFQIRDDILDYAPNIDTGKPAGHDLIEGKRTLPLLAALEQVSPSEREEVELWIKEVNNHPQAFAKICDFVQRHQGIELAQKAVEQKEREAITLLCQCPNTPARLHIEKMAAYLSGRKR